MLFYVAGLAGMLSRLLGRGQGGTVPGRVVMAVWPTALRRLTQGQTVVLVSGTNGKTTTTRLLATAVASRHSIVTNGSGANLMSGLVSAVLPGLRTGTVAVLEVDEAVLPAAIDATSPRVVVLLNLSRDQLDRFEEVGSHVRRWADALRSQRSIEVVANADDPLIVTAVRLAGLPEEQVTWVEAGAPWRGDVPLCPECGHAWDTQARPWSCEACGSRRPDAAWRLAGRDAIVDKLGRAMALRMALRGRAAAANAVMAAAAADLLGVPVTTALERFTAVTDVGGRYLTQMVGERSVQLLLAKNPAGWLEVLAELPGTPCEVMLGINARDADGTDPSWLWDVPFEQLRGREIVVFGDRALDLSVRLHYAEVAHTVVPSLAVALEAKSRGDALVAANYTAFVAARAVLCDTAA